MKKENLFTLRDLIKTKEAMIKEGLGKNLNGWRFIVRDLSIYHIHLKKFSDIVKRCDPNTGAMYSFFVFLFSPLEIDTSFLPVP